MSERPNLDDPASHPRTDLVEDAPVATVETQPPRPSSVIDDSIASLLSPHFMEGPSSAGVGEDDALPEPNATVHEARSTTVLNESAPSMPSPAEVAATQQQPQSVTDSTASMKPPRPEAILKPLDTVMLPRVSSVRLDDSALATPTVPLPAGSMDTTPALPSALKGAVPGRVRVHRRQTSIITPDEMSPMTGPVGSGAMPSFAGSLAGSPLTRRPSATGGDVVPPRTPEDGVKLSTIAPLQRTHSGHLLPRPHAKPAHHRRQSSYLSATDAEARVVALAGSSSAAFPESDFHRPTHAGAITVMSEVVVDGNRRVFRPHDVKITVGDTVIFRWYGHHKVAQVDGEGLPMLDGFGSEGVATRNGELVVTFDKIGVYYFESLNHHRCLRATVTVMDHQLVIVDTMIRYFVGLAVAALGVALVTMTVYILTHGRHFFVPDAPTDGSDDGNGVYRMIEARVIEDFVPWAVSATALMIVGCIAGVVRGCRRTLLSDFGRGYSERTQNIFQTVAFAQCLIVLLLVFVQWLVALQANHGFESAFAVFLDGVMSLINSVAATLADVKFLMTVAPQISSSAQVPASAASMVSDIEDLISTVKTFSSVGQTIVNAVFRGLAILLFLTLQSYLYVVSSGIVGVRRRRSTTIGASLALTTVGLLLVMFNAGSALFLIDALNTAKAVAADFRDSKLTPAELQRLVGVSPHSQASQFIGACNSGGVLSVTYINDQVQQLVAMWNANSPPELFLQAQIGNFTNVLVLNQYMEYLVAQVDTLQAKLDGNSTLAQAVVALTDDINGLYVPALRAALRVVKTLLTVVDCTVFRNVVAPVIPIVSNDVILGLSALLAVQYVQLLALIAYLYTSLIAAHVFDRPYKYWYEPKTQRWFRFRACFLAHRRLLMKARYTHNVSLRGSMKNSPEASSDNIALTIDENFPSLPAGLPPRPRPSASITSANAAQAGRDFAHSRGDSVVTSSLNATVSTSLGNKSMTWAMVARNAAHKAEQHSRNASIVGMNTTVSSTAPSETPSRAMSVIVPTVAAGKASSAITLPQPMVATPENQPPAPPPSLAPNPQPAGQPASEAATPPAVTSQTEVAASSDMSPRLASSGSMVLHPAAPSPSMPVALSHIDMDLDSAGASRTSSMMNVAAVERLPSPTLPRGVSDQPRQFSGDSGATEAAPITRLNSAASPNETIGDGTVMLRQETSLTGTFSDYGGEAPSTNPVSPRTHPDLDGWAVTEMTDHEIDFDSQYRNAQWFPPSKCSTPSLVSGMHQASLLSGAMLLFQSGLLVALHVSYADNHLSAVLQTATALCVVFPMLVWPADAMDDVRVRVGLRIGGFFFSIANFNLLLVSAAMDLSQTNYCIQHGSNVSASETSLEYLTGPCAIDVSLRELQSGVAALIVATSCMVALVSSGFMAVYAKHRVSNSISTLFAERAAATEEVEMKEMQLGEGSSNVAPVMVNPEHHDHTETSPTLSVSEVEFSRLDNSTGALHGSGRLRTVAKHFKRLLKQRARLRRQRFFRLLYMGVLVLVLVTALIMTTGALLGHWFSASPSTSTDLANDPLGCNGDVRWCSVPINEFAWFTTHNSMSALDQQFIGPNHYFGMPKQLDAGIRAFMIDAHPYPQWPNQTEAYEAWLCHDDCRLGGYKMTRDLELVKASMQLFPNDVYFLVLEQYSNDSAIVAAFEQVGLVDSIWTPPGSPKYNWTSWRWPTFAQLVAQGKRVVVWTDNPTTSSIADMGSKRPKWLGFMWDYMFESDYANEVLSDLKCRIGRGSELMPDNVTLSPLIKLKMNALNHFLTAPVAAPFLAQEANAATVLRSHFSLCSTEWGMTPNFVTVDFWDVQSPGVTVQQINYELHP